MKTALLALIMIFSTNLFAQKDTEAIRVFRVDSGNTKDTVGVFQKVEVEASFPGGIEAWRQFLYQNLRADAPFKEVPKKVKHFEQTAIVQFIVCKDGSLCEIKVLNNVLPSIKKEAERVIALSGKWEPAMQNGKEVKAYRKQPITFVVDSDQ